MRDRPPSTLLELKIRERRMTLGEFVQHAEDFARDHGERGTISMRHLQRLISQRERPTSMRPATRRLLEAIFATSAMELLGPPPRADLGEANSQVGAKCVSSVVADWQREAAEVTRLVARSARVDQEALDLLASQVENTRRLDRRFGASTLLGALRLHAEHVEQLLMHATDARIRRIPGRCAGRRPHLGRMAVARPRRDRQGVVSLRQSLRGRADHGIIGASRPRSR